MNEVVGMAAVAIVVEMIAVVGMVVVFVFVVEVVGEYPVQL